jgi:serine/threonine protein kinase
VWRAVDRTTGKVIALKILDREKTQKYESRFLDRNKPSEGEIAVQLLHPHIVRTWEYGRTTDNEQFLVCELIDGCSLAYLVDMQNEVLQKGRLRILTELAEAIAYLHEHKWIHRDVCPRNVLIDKEGRVKLIDFGLVVPNLPAFQMPGNRTGTANYMAPELIKRQHTDERIDVFSFAVTCFEMYTKAFPWPVTNSAPGLEAMLKRINQNSRHIREVLPEIDEQVGSIIMRGLEIDPHNRWPSIGEMLTALREARARLEKPPEAPAKAPKKGPPRRRRDDLEWQFRPQ